MASRLLVSRLNRVDLPTFGRPTRAITGTIRLSIAIFQKTRRPLQGSGHTIERSAAAERQSNSDVSVVPANGQCDQLAVIAEHVQPIALDNRARTHPGAVDTLTGHETPI